MPLTDTECTLMESIKFQPHAFLLLHAMVNQTFLPLKLLSLSSLKTLPSTTLLDTLSKPPKTEMLLLLTTLKLLAMHTTKFGVSLIQLFPL